MIPLPNFEPDRSRYAPNASTVITNALPVADGWGPLPDIVAISSALPSPCVGAKYVRRTDGTYRLIAGTITNIYELDPSDYTWTDISGPSAPYNVPAGDEWQFEAFGDQLIAANIADVLQYLAIDAGTAFADLPGSPPKARYIWTAGEYLVLGYHEGFANRIMTSGIGDASWWTVGQRGCDYQDFPDGGEIMGGFGVERGAIIFQRSKIRQMTIAQIGDYSFQTAVINQSRGCVAPLSIVPIGPGQFVYYSEDGFSLGVEGKSIGKERVDQWFYETADSIFIAQVRGAADPFRRIVWFQAQDVNGDKFLLGYSWHLDRWCYADSNVSRMVNMVTPGLTWDALDELYATIDDADQPFDSALFLGGAPRFAAFTSDDELGFFSGAARAATLETAEIELMPGRRAFLQELQAYTDSNDYTLQVGTADKHGEAVTWGNTVTPHTSTGICHFRSSAKIHRIRMNIAAGATGKHSMGFEPVFVGEGRR